MSMALNKNSITKKKIDFNKIKCTENETKNVNNNKRKKEIYV